MTALLKSMDPSVQTATGKASSAGIYNAMVMPATSADPDAISSSKQWAADMQSQCLQLVHQLSSNQTMHRHCESDELEYIESEYTDLIEFISGVGASCAELSARLNDAG